MGTIVPIISQIMNLSHGAQDYVHLAFQEVLEQGSLAAAEPLGGYRHSCLVIVLGRFFMISNLKVDILNHLQ